MCTNAAKSCIGLFIMIFNYYQEEVLMLRRPPSPLWKIAVAFGLITVALLMNGFRFVFLPWIQSDKAPQLWAESNDRIEVVDDGTYELNPGLTIDKIFIERDSAHLERLTLHLTTRPFRPGESPRTRVFYFKEESKWAQLDKPRQAVNCKPRLSSTI